MPRRIEIELTSSRDDGTWTWRAAGAKEPRGTVGNALLPQGAAVGDVLRVDAEFFIDGIEITGVVPTKEVRKEPERLELLAPPEGESLVTTTLAARTRDDRRPRRDGRRDGERDERGGRKERPGRPERKDRTDRGERDERAERGGRKDGPPRRARPAPPPVPAVERPKAKRLRPGKAHRSALLESLPEAERPVAEQLVLGGIPAVRQAIDKQNAERTAGGEQPIPSRSLLELAERLAPKVRTAEWRDRAEAAQRDLEVIDLRDLRSVVSTADATARDDETRALAATLREGLASRVEAEHAAWLAELTATIEVGRIVRALRLSSRPPKAGAPLPPELSAKLVESAGAALTSDAAPERWVAVLEALAFAPVRDKVIPASLPTDLHPDVRATVARTATRIPKIAHIFEITPDRSAPRPKQERRKPRKPAGPRAEAKKARTEPKKARAEQAPAADAPATETEQAPAADAPATETEQAPVADAPGTESEPAAVADAPGTESEQAPAADAPGTESEPAPVADASGTESEPAPAADAPATETEQAPAADAPTPETESEPAPAADAPATESESEPAPAADAPATEARAEADEAPMTDEPATQRSGVDEPPVVDTEASPEPEPGSP